MMPEIIKIANIMRTLGIKSLEEYTNYVAQCVYNCEHSCDDIGTITMPVENERLVFTHEWFALMDKCPDNFIER